MLFESYIDPEYRLKINPETGKVADNKVIRRITKEEFIMVFLRTIPDMFKLQGLELKILMIVWMYSRYNPANSFDGNIFENNYFLKKEIKDKFDISDRTINVYISNLTKKGFLIKKNKGCYMLNPKYFFKGTIDDSSKLSLIFSNQEIKDVIYK